MAGGGVGQDYTQDIEDMDLEVREMQQAFKELQFKNDEIVNQL